MEELMILIKRLEFHQSLLLKMCSDSNEDFFKLVILKGIDEKEVLQFYKLCEELSKKFEKQKAEGFVSFHPLFHIFVEGLPQGLNPDEVIVTCIKQKLHVPLMNELKNYL